MSQILTRAGPAPSNESRPGRVMLRENCGRSLGPALRWTSQPNSTSPPIIIGRIRAGFRLSIGAPRRGLLGTFVRRTSMSRGNALSRRAFIAKRIQREESFAKTGMQLGWEHRGSDCKTGLPHPWRGCNVERARRGAPRSEAGGALRHAHHDIAGRSARGGGGAGKVGYRYRPDPVVGALAAPRLPLQLPATPA